MRWHACPSLRRWLAGCHHTMTPLPCTSAGTCHHCSHLCTMPAVCACHGTCLPRYLPAMQYLQAWTEKINAPPYTEPPYSPSLHNTTFYPPPGSYNSSDRFTKLAVLKSASTLSSWRCVGARVSAGWCQPGVLAGWRCGSMRATVFKCWTTLLKFAPSAFLAPPLARGHP